MTSEISQIREPNFYNRTPTTKVELNSTDLTTQQSAHSIFKNIAMTALISTTSLAIGAITFCSAIIAFGIFNAGPNISQSLLLLTNTMAAITTGITITNKKMVLSAVLVCVTTLGCFLLNSSMLPGLMLTMTAISVISSSITLLVKALKAEKLALKSI